MGGKNDQNSKINPNRLPYFIGFCVIFGLLVVPSIVIAVIYNKKPPTSSYLPPPLKLNV